jgi:hypothetical protein
VPELETLLRQLERLDDARVRDDVRAIVRAVIEMHRAALDCVLGALVHRAGEEALGELARDEQVASVLLLHGLHPVAADTRVRSALEALGPALRAINAAAELAQADENGLRVVVRESGAGASRAVALVEDAVCAAAPDATVTIERRSDPAAEALVPVARLLASRQHRAEDEHCELCAASIADSHDHLVDPDAREVRCACGACAALFDGGSGARWKRVARRVTALDAFRLEDDLWDEMGLPVRVAFFCRSSKDDRVVAMYPGPGGAAESLLSLDAWGRVEDRNPVLRTLACDVEALLVRRRRDGGEYYRVSIDACYALVGRIRTHWRGLGGGADAWAQIDAFFDELRAEGVSACAS